MWSDSAIKQAHAQNQQNNHNIKLAHNAAQISAVKKSTRKQIAGYQKKLFGFDLIEQTIKEKRESILRLG